MILSKQGQEILSKAFDIGKDFNQDKLIDYFNSVSNYDFSGPIYDYDNVPQEYHRYGGCVGTIAMMFKDKILITHLGNCRI